MMKVAIIGYSGSGKSTLAREIGVVNDIPVLHLDTVQFLPNWQVKEDKEALKEVSDFMAREQWIIEGELYTLSSSTKIGRSNVDYLAEVLALGLFKACH